MGIFISYHSQKYHLFIDLKETPPSLFKSLSIDLNFKKVKVQLYYLNKLKYRNYKLKNCYYSNA